MKVRRFNENTTNFDEEAKYILESLEDFMPNDDLDSYDCGIDKYYFSEDFKDSIRISDFGQGKKKPSTDNVKAIYTKVGYTLIGTINLVDTIDSSSDNPLDYDKVLDDMENFKSLVEFLKIKSNDNKDMKIIANYYNGSSRIYISIIDLNSKV